MRSAKNMSQDETEAHETAIRNLVETGRKNGSLRYWEVIDSLPDASLGKGAVEKLLGSLVEQGITIVGSGESIQEPLEQELEKDDFSWISRSSLTERAYWIGAYQACRYLCESGRAPSLSSVLLQTFYRRVADDSFESIPLGRIYRTLEKVSHDRDVSFQTIEAHLREVRSSIDEYNRLWGREFRQAEEITQELSTMVAKVSGSDSRKDEEFTGHLIELVRALEHSLRRLSLLDTSHDLQDRFK